MLALSPLTPLLAIMPAKMGTMVLAWGSYDHDQPCQQCSTQLRYLDLCIRAYSWHRTKEAACPASTRKKSCCCCWPNLTPCLTQIPLLPSCVTYVCCRIRSSRPEISRAQLHTDHFLVRRTTLVPRKYDICTCQVGCWSYNE